MPDLLCENRTLMRNLDECFDVQSPRKRHIVLDKRQRADALETFVKCSERPVIFEKKT